MSLFGDIFRDLQRDPIFGHQQRSMNRMMDSFLGGSGFGLGGNLLGGGQARNQMMMPFGGGFPGMGIMSPFAGFSDMGEMMSDPNGHSFCSTSVMSVTSGPDGRPQVYHASSATRQAPGGVKETRKTLSDTRTGTKKMAVGRHLGDRGHVREREENMNTGQREENEDFINIGEEEAQSFNYEWRQRAYGGHGQHTSIPALGGTGYNVSAHPAYNHNHRSQLQLTQRPHREAEHVVSRGGVTIEELPSSDNEDGIEIVEKTLPNSSRASRLPTIPRVGRKKEPRPVSAKTNTKRSTGSKK